MGNFICKMDDVDRKNRIIDNHIKNLINLVNDDVNFSNYYNDTILNMDRVAVIKKLCDDGNDYVLNIMASTYNISDYDTDNAIRIMENLLNHDGIEMFVLKVLLSDIICFTLIVRFIEIVERMYKHKKNYYITAIINHLNTETVVHDLYMTFDELIFLLSYGLNHSYVKKQYIDYINSIFRCIKNEVNVVLGKIFPRELINNINKYINI
jgi:hypothetical protein